MARFFAEASTASLSRVAEEALFAERIARAPGLLQGIDPRVKLAGLGALVVAAALSHRLSAIAAVFALALLLAVASRVRPVAVLVRLWAAALGFTLVLGLPALVLTPGPVVARLPLGLAVTATGLRTLAYLVGRVETAATLSLLLVLSTRWTSLLRGLRSLGAPVVLVVILGMTHRYIFVLLQTAQDLLAGRRSRRVGKLPAAEGRRLAAATAGVLLTRSLALSDEVYLAMQSRGFRGEVHVMDDPRMRRRDWAALSAFAVAAVAVAWIGR